MGVDTMTEAKQVRLHGVNLFLRTGFGVHDYLLLVERISSCWFSLHHDDICAR
jgi:hypothetical protein